MSSDGLRKALIPSVSQYDVDFVIPRVGVDLPLGIDPFLLFKSRDPEYRSLHEVLLSTFNTGIDAVRKGRQAEAARLFDFPEVSSIGLGYTRNSKRGSGVGTRLTGLILETLASSPSLLQRGVRHVEEMQLVSAGFGPDRVSDITANLIKRFLIEYTQRQSAIWNLPLTRGIPVNHIYNPQTHAWDDSYEDLPVSPVDKTPILLVPRRLVRNLPWINYDDFMRTEFNAYLDARRQKARPSRGTPNIEVNTDQGVKVKADVIAITRSDIRLVERYVESRERQSANAQPALDYIDEDACREAEILKEKLTALPSGLENAADYQRLVLEILNYLFNPELIDGRLEVRTVDGTERRDIVFTNDSDEPFWDFVRNQHSSILIMFEVKNTDKLDLTHVNQTATYLGERMGRLGIIVSRSKPTETIRRKIYSVWNDSGPSRKAILTLSDEQLSELLSLRCRNGSPTKWLQRHYRAFREALQ